MLLLGVGGDGNSGVAVQQAALLLLFAAVSPAGEAKNLAWMGEGSLKSCMGSHRL
jgi:hypothetical protein